MIEVRSVKKENTAHDQKKKAETTAHCFSALALLLFVCVSSHPFPLNLVTLSYVRKLFNCVFATLLSWSFFYFSTLFFSPFSHLLFFPTPFFTSSITHSSSSLHPKTMSTYGTTNATPESAPTRDAEQQALLNHRDIHEANDTFYGRTFIHVHTHRKRYFALWLLAAVTAVATVLVVHYAYKQHKGHDDDDDLLAMLGKGKGKPDVCHSDRSYPVAILLSIFFGYVG